MRMGGARLDRVPARGRAVAARRHRSRRPGGRALQLLRGRRSPRARPRAEVGEAGAGAQAAGGSAGADLSRRPERRAERQGRRPRPGHHRVPRADLRPGHRLLPHHGAQHVREARRDLGPLLRPRGRHRGREEHSDRGPSAAGRDHGERDREHPEAPAGHAAEPGDLPAQPRRAVVRPRQPLGPHPHRLRAGTVHHRGRRRQGFADDPERGRQPARSSGSRPAATYGVPWQVLAAINKIESNFGRTWARARPARSAGCSSCPRPGASGASTRTATASRTRGSRPTRSTPRRATSVPRARRRTCRAPSTRTTTRSGTWTRCSSWRACTATRERARSSASTRRSCSRTTTSTLHAAEPGTPAGGADVTLHAVEARAAARRRAGPRRALALGVHRPRRAARSRRCRARSVGWLREGGSLLEAMAAQPAAATSAYDMRFRQMMDPAILGRMLTVQAASGAASASATRRLVGPSSNSTGTP